MQTVTYYTAEEYLALDAEAGEGIRYEYWDGQVVAMAGAEPEHNVLKGNIAAELRNRLLKRGCRVMTSDQRVQVGSRYVYPDVVVTCRPDYAPTRPRTLLNPELLVEVTSASTAGTDRGSKLAAYTELDSLQEYWVAESNRVLLTQYVRHEAGWILHIYTHREAMLRSAHFDLEIPVEAFYALVLQD
jgi:Uma2 family endonuclease